MLKPGDKAPNFTLVDQHGEKFSLSGSLKNRKVWHMLYFYPEAETPGTRSGVTALVIGTGSVEQPSRTCTAYVLVASG